VNTKNSVWRNKYRTLSDYYKHEFLSGTWVNPNKPDEDPRPFYKFSPSQLEIDPDETLDDINEYDEERQEIEYIKCATDFSYFCHKYVKIFHPIKGPIPFIPFAYQIRCVESFEKNRFTIISKFRQGGITTVAELYSMWKCIFRKGQQILFISKTDREAITAGEIITKAAENMPSWLLNYSEGKWNDHIKQFKDTDSAMFFYAPIAARGRSSTFLIVDECAFIDGMDEHWAAIFPTLATGGSAAIISTTNGLGNFYAKTYHDAIEKKNLFAVVDLDYWEHKQYNDPSWVAEQRAQLGEKKFEQEILRSFLGGGNTYIPTEVIVRLQQEIRYTNPIKIKLQQYANLGDKKDAAYENIEQQNGALWIWKEPQIDREYVIGVDASEGNNNENSAIQIIDKANLEQVAEFYSDNVQPHVLSQICSALGVHYNHALLVIENMSAGSTVLSNLLYDLGYDNIFYSINGKSRSPGIKTTQQTRPIIIETIQRRLVNGTLKIKSPRLVRELMSFVYNKNDKPGHKSGSYDDAIFAMCLALYVIDQESRDTPVIGLNSNQPFKKIQNSIYDDIKKEIAEEDEDHFYKEFMRKKKDLIEFGDEQELGVAINFRRKFSKLLDSFGF
jgi:hypothetical protein